MDLMNLLPLKPSRQTHSKSDFPISLHSALLKHGDLWQGECKPQSATFAESIIALIKPILTLLTSIYKNLNVINKCVWNDKLTCPIHPSKPWFTPVNDDNDNLCLS